MRNAGTRLRTIAFALVVLASAAAVPVAGASQLIDRNATNLKLLVNAKGEALAHLPRGRHVRARARVGRGERGRADGDAQADRVQARLRGRLGEVLPRRRAAFADAPGEVPQIRARRATSTSPTVKELAAKSTFAKQLLEAVLPRRVPALRRAEARVGVTACKAPDGSYWAVQAWQRKLPELRPRRQRPRRRPPASCTSRTGRAALPVLTSAPTGRGTSGTTSSAPSPTTARRSSASTRRRPASRSTRFGRNLYVDTLRLGLRHRLEAREQLPDAQGRRCLLLQRQPARRPPGRHGHEVPRDDHGPRRDARRDVGRAGARRLRQGDGRRAQHRDRRPARHALPAELSRPGARRSPSPRAAVASAERRGQ